MVVVSYYGDLSSASEPPYNWFQGVQQNWANITRHHRHHKTKKCNPLDIQKLDESTLEQMTIQR